KPRLPQANTMAALLHKYRREFAAPFAISHHSSKEGYCSYTNEGEMNDPLHACRVLVYRRFPISLACMSGMNQLGFVLQIRIDRWSSTISSR
uniref:Uncharacterized protein n=1 Tax=Aegilops tauschii subsp. strangulata TaxID=200361 RepID=A0A453H8Q5_AEGTS